MNGRHEAASLLRRALALLDQEKLHLAAAHTAQAIECLAPSPLADDADAGEPAAACDAAGRAAEG
jgi:hypothetical protein